VKFKKKLLVKRFHITNHSKKTIDGIKILEKNEKKILKYLSKESKEKTTKKFVIVCVNI